MSKLAIVTDSTASIPDDLIKNLPISIIPLHVIWGEEMYQDNVDIHQEEFYKRLPLSKILPSTSQPSPKEFIEMYKSIGREFDEILSVHISSKLSGTVDSALQAKNYLSSMHIEVVDSLSTSMGLGFLALIAAREAQKGKNLAYCKSVVESAQKRLHVYFVLHTLEFLKRGGRIGGASALLGTALNLKPVLMLDEGIIEPYEKVRTMRKALLRLTEILRQKSESKTPIHLALIHALAEQDTEFLLTEIKKRFTDREITEIVVAGISPVLGTHAGPGAIGICFLTDK